MITFFVCWEYLCLHLVFLLVCHPFSCLLPIICTCYLCRVEFYSTQMHFYKKYLVNSSIFNVGSNSQIDADRKKFQWANKSSLDKNSSKNLPNFIFSQENFSNIIILSNETVSLLKVLEGLARLKWLKAFTIFYTRYRPRLSKYIQQFLLPDF